MARNSLFILILMMGISTISCPPPENPCNSNNAIEFQACIEFDNGSATSRTTKSGSIPNSTTPSGAEIRFSDLKKGPTLASVQNLYFNSQGDATQTYNVFSGDFVSVFSIIDASSQGAAKVFFQLTGADQYVEFVYSPPLSPGTTFKTTFKIPSLITSGQITAFISIEGSGGAFSNTVTVIMNVVSQSDQATPPTTQTVTTRTTTMTTQTILSTTTILTVTTLTTTQTTLTQTTSTQTSTQTTLTTVTTLTSTTTTLFIEIYVAGYATVSGNPVWFIKKYDQNGVEDTVNWNKIVDNSGTAGEEKPYSVVVDASRNVYVAGTLHNGTDTDWAIKKYDANGVEDLVNWNKVINLNGNDVLRNIAIDSMGNVYAIGHDTAAICIKKYDSSGVEDAVNWNKTIDNPSYADGGYDIAFDSLGNVYIAAAQGTALLQDWWLKKYSSGGTELIPGWNKIIDRDSGADLPYSIAVDSLDNLYFGGELYFDSGGSQITGLKKFNTGGTEDTVNWNKQISFNVSGSRINDVVIDQNDEVYSIIDDLNVWRIKKYSPSGVEDMANWNKMIDNGMGGERRPYAAAVDNLNNLYVVGYTNNGVTGWDAWIKKYDQNGVEDTGNWNKLLDSGTSGNDSATGIAIYPPMD